MPTLASKPAASQSFASHLKGRWGDRLLLLAMLIMIALLWQYVRASIGSGPAMAEIYHGDTLIAEYPLPGSADSPLHLDVEGDLGLSEIVIDQQGARIASSPCPSQRCVLAGPHNHAGDIIACVPNRILIALRGGNHSRFDAMVE